MIIINRPVTRRCTVMIRATSQHGEGSKGIALLFLYLRRYMGWVVNATPRPHYPRERPGTHCIGGWAGLEGCGKSRHQPGLDPRTVQPVASRYTD